MRTYLIPISLALAFTGAATTARSQVAGVVCKDSSYAPDASACGARGGIDSAGTAVLKHVIGFGAESGARSVIVGEPVRVGEVIVSMSTGGGVARCRLLFRAFPAWTKRSNALLDRAAAGLPASVPADAADTSSCANVVRLDAGALASVAFQISDSGGPKVAPMLLADLRLVVHRIDSIGKIARTVVVSPLGLQVADDSLLGDAGPPDTEAALLPGNPAPEYPQQLRMSNVQGEVLASFVVDTSGRVDEATFKVLRSSDALFTEAVRRVLHRLRFSPALKGDHKLNQVVVMPFEFHLTAPDAE